MEKNDWEDLKRGDLKIKWRDERDKKDKREREKEGYKGRYNWRKERDR